MTRGVFQKVGLVGNSKFVNPRKGKLKLNVSMLLLHSETVQRTRAEQSTLGALTETMEPVEPITPSVECVQVRVPD